MTSAAWSRKSRIASYGRMLRNIRKQPRLSKVLVGRLLVRTGLSRFFLIRRDLYALRFYPSALSTALWVDPWSRQNTEHFFRRYLKPGDVVVDVGANIGSLTMEASLAVGPSGHVIAFEAHPRVFGYLRGNLALNGASNTEIHNLALGKDSGEVVFSDRSADDQNGISTGEGIVVPMVRLDDLPSGLEVALVKIDVEGYEKFVIEGAPATLDRTSCVYFECSEDLCLRYGYSAAELFGMLERSGFRLYRQVKGERNKVRAATGDRHDNLKGNVIGVREPAQFLARTGFEQVE